MRLYTHLSPKWKTSSLPCFSDCLRQVSFLFRQEKHERSRHRGGVNAALPRVKYTRPYVPHPWRTFDTAQYCEAVIRQGGNRNISALVWPQRLKALPAGGGAQGEGAFCEAISASPCADFFGSFLVRRQEMNTLLFISNKKHPFGCFSYICALMVEIRISPATTRSSAAKPSAKLDEYSTWALGGNSSSPSHTRICIS